MKDSKRIALVFLKDRDGNETDAYAIHDADTLEHALELAEMVLFEAGHLDPARPASDQLSARWGYLFPLPGNTDVVAAEADTEVTCRQALQAIADTPHVTGWTYGYKGKWLTLREYVNAVLDDNQGGRVTPTIWRTCPACKGEPRLRQHPKCSDKVRDCARCGGRGSIQLTVTIPPKEDE